MSKILDWKNVPAGTILHLNCLSGNLTAVVCMFDMERGLPLVSCHFDKIMHFHAQRGHAATVADVELQPWIPISEKSLALLSSMEGLKVQLAYCQGDYQICDWCDLEPGPISSDIMAYRVAGIADGYIYPDERITHVKK